ncbi:hypothetical protein [Archangium lipolyticum]|uniref:hypothetical protein n=1 Tax=Archangium lipolyticum TaxID=2970465 RepID=UPI00214A6EC6|nr:hypothetical protein [Archangium lipolyticum]
MVQIIGERRVDDEKGEQLGPGGTVLPGGGDEECGAFAVEDIGALAQRTQGAEPDGGPAIQSFHHPGHIQPVLQRDEFSWRGARQKGGEHLLAG